MYSVTVRLPDDLAQRLRAEAFRTGKSINKLVAFALLAYLEDDHDRS